MSTAELCPKCGNTMRRGQVIPFARGVEPAMRGKAEYRLAMAVQSPDSPNSANLATGVTNSQAMVPFLACTNCRLGVFDIPEEVLSA